MLAVGETVVLLGRNFDISIGSTVGLSAMVAGLVFKADAGTSEILVFGIAVAVGATVGISNGLLITYLRVPSIVLTLGMLYVVSGITYIVARGSQVNPYNVPSGFVALSITSPIDGIPWIVIIAFAFAAVMLAVLRWTRHGRSLYALGSNAEAARLRGLPARRLVIASFALSGAAAGLGGAIYLSQYGLVQVNAGSGLELQAITAAIVGGVSIYGGSGTIFGVAAACVLLGAISNGIAVLGYSLFLQTPCRRATRDRGRRELGESPDRSLAFARPAGAEVVRWRLVFADLAGAREVVTFGMLLIAFTIFSLESPYFLGSLNFSFILTNSVEIGFIALTMTVVMVMGEIDLSVGSTVGLAAATLGAMVTHGVPFVIAVVITLATGLVAGLLNAALCIRFQLPSLVVTLGTLALYRGIAELLIGGNTVTNFPSWFLGWNIDYAFGKITYTEIFWFFCTRARSSFCTDCGLAGTRASSAPTRAQLSSRASASTARRSWSSRLRA